MSDDRLVVYAHVLGRITSSLERQNIDVSTLEVFKDLQLAVTHFNANTPVDILLGSEHVWSVFTGRKIYDNKGNLIAIFVGIRMGNHFTHHIERKQRYCTNHINGYRQHASEVLRTGERSKQHKIGTGRRPGREALSRHPQSR